MSWSKLSERYRRAMRLGAAAFICGVLAVGVAACGGDSDSGNGGGDSDTFRIGWAQAKTGYLALVDEPLEKGLRAEIEAINAAGGIDGKYMVELDARDMQTDAATGATVAQELVGEGIDLLITTCDTDLSLPGAQIAAQEGIPVISSCGAGAQFPNQVPSPFGFLNVAGTEAEGSAIAEYADRQGYKTAYVVSSTSEAYTRDLPEAFKTRFTELGGEIIGESQFKLGDTDYRATATRIVAANPDVIVPGAFPPDSIAFLNNLEAAGNTSPIILNDGNDTPAIFGAGPQVQNSTMITYGGYTGEDDEATRTWVEAYTEMFGHPPETLQTALGADLVAAFAAAITEAGTTEGTAVAEALRNLPEFMGATGPVSYSAAEELGMSPGVPKKLFAVATLDPATKTFNVTEHFFPEKVVE